MRKVLFIAYHFPPIGGSGTQRPVKFAKYLPQFGWQPYVISTDRTCGEEGVDETLLADIPPDVKVWRVPTPRPRPVVWLQRLVGWKPAMPEVTSVVAQGSEQPTLSAHSYVKRFCRAVLSPLYLVQEPPVDDALYWSLRIIPLARRIIEREQIDVIFTTSPPWSPLLAGLLLKKWSGRPWVADMRDPWTTDRLRYLNRGWRRRFDEMMERTCLRTADVVATVQADWLDDLRHQAGDRRDEKRFILITNGFDKDDFAEVGLLKFPRSNNHITVCHPGSMYRGSLGPLLRSLEWVEPPIRSRLRFDLVGYLHPEDRAQLTSSSVGDLFTHQPDRVTHPEALGLMQSAHVLLLPLPFDYYPGKLFEYMRAERPVLAIAREGVAADLIRRSGIGCVVSPDDQEELARVLRQIANDYQSFVAQHYHPNWDVIDQFDRRVLTRKLAEVLSTTCVKSQPRSIW